MGLEGNGNWVRGRSEKVRVQLGGELEIAGCRSRRSSGGRLVGRWVKD